MKFGTVETESQLIKQLWATLDNNNHLKRTQFG